ncbi:MAG: radical SAM protein [Geobacter sp.]|nr:radical SAM protein [Geobacter sp.]
MNILFLTSAAPDKSGFFTTEKRPPIGLGYLISVVKQAGHQVFFSDEYLKPTNILETDFLVRNNIELVGIYANTICYDATLSMFRSLHRKREQKEWNGRIIVGGPHTSVGWEEIPDYVDRIVIGEGEISVPKIINGGIGERLVIGEKVEDLDSLPLPAWEEFIHRPYDWTHPWYPSYPVYTFNTSRGCPFDCTFCSVKSIWGKSYRYMSAERVVHDIEHMIRYYGARGIYFREDHFTLNKKRTVEFCELLLRKKIRIDWFCETRVDQLNDYDYQKLMADAGCRVFYIGVESGSSRMLEFYRKGETREQFIRAFEIARKVGIKTYASFVVGVPTETEDDLRQTEDLIKVCNPDYIGKNVYLGIPGSELYDFVRENNMYEFEDNKHILYPVGFKRNALKYYGKNSYLDLYELPSAFSHIIKLLNKSMQCRLKSVLFR